MRFQWTIMNRIDTYTTALKCDIYTYIPNSGYTGKMTGLTLAVIGYSLVCLCYMWQIKKFIFILFGFGFYINFGEN